ncbi:hypothetical protein [Rhodococcus maanshanensis]|uniref:Sporulation protein YtfJ (Spore_YtfJ) n=1 Tax=Rhodococcus maanshanensis TaxID=183556 RepID=A0A1H7XRD4_9NOCA|nr:hypothetical protein [Rhodococcus maanshanensis]SEM36321.1 hypothetical protein SAMN05444583_13412 [Rhodococcus maanshanensis]
MEIRKVADRLPPGAGGLRVYGEPYETANGATIITVARIGGRRMGTSGAVAVPVGVFVIHDGEVAWKPAVDETRIALMALSIGLASAVLATLAVLRRPPWPDLSRR